MNRWKFTALAGMILAAIGAVASFEALTAAQNQAEPAKRQLREFMRRKLDASNQVLEGLVTEDFALVRDGATALQEISSSEKWRISNDALYRQYSAEFQSMAERLEQAAKAEKLDAAALVWVETTISCIECHKHARAILIADQPRAAPFELGAVSR
jgi:hypothetical protein